MPDPNAILLGVMDGALEDWRKMVGDVADLFDKAADLCSKLSGAGYDVHVMMTDSARHLISDKLFFTLSRNPVIFDLWDTPTWKPGHIEISELASLMVIAPCTANFLGKYANGIADDALTTSAMAYQGEVLLAPAMNTRMWQNPAVRRNCETLRSWGVHFVGPGKGRLACGDNGEGRMAEVPEILEAIRSLRPRP